jgi:HEPN pEK499 p136
VKEVSIGPRNDPLGLALRSVANLEIIEQIYAQHGAGHVVTQVVQSLLAFVVFPKERRMFDYLQGWSLDYINSKPKWPNLTPSLDARPGKPTKTLYDVLYHMRNAVCHGLVTFLGEGPDGPNSRDLSQISVRFEDKLPGKNKSIDWSLTLTGPDLRKFCDLIVEVVQAD